MVLGHTGSDFGVYGNGVWGRWWLGKEEIGVADGGGAPGALCMGLGLITSFNRGSFFTEFELKSVTK